jgi:hypothetical protein
MHFSPFNASFNASSFNVVSAKASRIRSQGELRSRAKPAKIDKF